MKCKNCDATMLKSAKYCDKCGTKNEEFETESGRIDRLEKELVETKTKLAALETRGAAPNDDEPEEEL